MDVCGSNREQMHHDFRVPHGKVKYVWHPANSNARMSQRGDVLAPSRPSIRLLCCMLPSTVSLAPQLQAIPSPSLDLGFSSVRAELG